MIEVDTVPVRRGIIQFRKQDDYTNILELSQVKPLSSLVEDEEWQISHSCFQKLLNTGILKSIDVLYLKSLRIRWWGTGNSFNIIKDIGNISFPCLKELYLNGNLIQNIEAIANFNLRTVTSLNLKQNNIVDIKPLRKCLLSNLKELTLYNNRILDFTPLQELQAPVLANIWTIPQSDCFDCQQACSWILKLQSDRLKKVFIQHPKGHKFDFPNVQTMMTVKYGPLELTYQLRDDINVRLQ